MGEVIEAWTILNYFGADIGNPCLYLSEAPTEDTRMPAQVKSDVKMLCSRKVNSLVERVTRVTREGFFISVEVPAPSAQLQSRQRKQPQRKQRIMVRHKERLCDLSGVLSPETKAMEWFAQFVHS